MLQYHAINLRLRVDCLLLIRDRFLESECHVLFAAEKSCWPRRNHARQWPDGGTEYP